jgi:hypothetical protein
VELRWEALGGDANEDLAAESLKAMEELSIHNAHFIISLLTRTGKSPEANLFMPSIIIDA